MTADASEHDDAGWAGFYAAQQGRAPRKPFEGALAGIEHRLGGPGVAADIGCGDGTETRVLLRRGWRVTAVDADASAPSFVVSGAETADLERLQLQNTPFAEMQLPPLDFAWAGMSLPFCPPADFAAAWQHIVAALKPGALFAGHFIGPRDSWAMPEEGLSIHDSEVIRALLVDFDLLTFDEREWDGGSGGGPKHWHLFEVVAARR
jgi:SAM-dependent methyltransferase